MKTNAHATSQNKEQQKKASFSCAFSPDMKRRTNDSNEKKKAAERSRKVAFILEAIEKWNSVVCEGKSVIAQILALKKESEGNRDLNEELQDQCQMLRDISIEFTSLSREIEAVKINSLNESKNGSFIGQDELAKSHEVIARKLQDQSALMVDVAENIGSTESLDRAVCFACIWTFQPELDDDYFLALKWINSTFCDG